MTLPRSLAVLVIVAAAWTSPARADCAAFLAAFGRGYDADAPLRGADDLPVPEAPGALRGCPPGHAYQFAYDVPAADAARPVTRADQMIGTWLGDDILGIAAGLFIPVYEVLEIAPGPEPGQIALTQKLVRATDPADWLAEQFNPGGPVDVVRAGRIATYAEAVVEISDRGAFLPRRVRRGEVLADSDRTTDLMMKLRYLPLPSQQPADVGLSGDRLVFTLRTRFGRDRRMTFVKRDPRAIRDGMRLALVLDLPMALYPCFVRQLETPGPELAAALGTATLQDLSAQLDALFETEATVEDLSAQLRRKGGDAAQRTDTQKHLMAMLQRRVEIGQAPPLRQVADQAGGGRPLGCPPLF